MGLLLRSHRHARTTHDSDVPPAPQLDVSSVSKSYGRVGPLVLHDVDLAIGRGELVSLLGPSGCGKTTLLRLVAGFLEPNAGSIRIGGVDATRLPPHRRSIGMVHQSYALWPHMTVAENVGFGLEMRRVARRERVERVARLLELVGLAGFERRLPGQLSGGQQQRVALARALVVNPDLLLLDEPLAALDANLRHELQRHLREIQREVGVTTVMVTHDREEAMAVSDRIIVLEGGRIIQAEDAHTLYTSPASAFVMRFTGEANLVEGTVQDRAGGEAVISSPLGRVALPVRGHEVVRGERVLVGFRPESAALGCGASAPSTDGATLHATCRYLDGTFLGSTWLHRVELGGTVISCRVPAALGRLACRRGDDVSLAIHIGALLAFPRPINPSQEDQ